MHNENSQINWNRLYSNGRVELWSFTNTFNDRREHTIKLDGKTVVVEDIDDMLDAVSAYQLVCKLTEEE